MSQNLKPSHKSKSQPLEFKQKFKYRKGKSNREAIDMKGEICMVIALVLLVLSLFNASVVMAQTLKYAPAPQERPQGF